ncbi:reverse transcriptase domain-containing protein [Bacillus mycoides]|uniref:Reverse transcriptase domain-containing protein n=1 Tax=Bacillus mycoides TaxID=1405 RepID=A0AAP8GX05_BACMY|nr:reverse transcriptase domain-containing protein [Bacillus mycoides]PJN67769.1 hypothetical protein BAWEI_07310 [Bacillus mycoides]PJN70228.1 hypothetical protein BACWE_32690 [Bacillus mycoides]
MEYKIDEISKLLLKNFFFNKKTFARQTVNEDGKPIYLRKRNKITAAVLTDMLKNRKSIMAYQQVRHALKWICLDLDIAKKYLNDDYDFFGDSESKDALFEVYKNVIEVLEDNEIHYLSEFSGNRGIHIWIAFDTYVTKNIGYEIVKRIADLALEKSDMSVRDRILIDKYPKNGDSKSNSIGLGVKIPLSYHIKSSRYSFMFHSLSEIRVITELTEELLNQQIEILKKLKENAPYDIIRKLEIKIEDTTKEDFVRTDTVIKDEVTLADVVSTLKKSIYFEDLFNKPLVDWNERDRVLLVATLCRVRSPQNEDLGYNLLKQFFASETEIYDEALTIQKLDKLKNLYPPTIVNLKKVFGKQCPYCEAENIKNVIELLNKSFDIEVKSREKQDTQNIIEAERRYLHQNDEVPLSFIEADLINLNDLEVEENLKQIENGEYKEPVEFYKYIRLENEEKKRSLYSLGAKDRVITTSLAFKLNSFMYSDFSMNSYGYRLNYSSQPYIFENWSKSWLEYVYNIESNLNDGSYDDYYLIKLDIQSFYDSVNHIHLREILAEKVKENFNEENVSKLINIIDYLINTNAQIVGNRDKGLPQGPAYARILAELYLTMLDAKIEQQLDLDFECYYRYVDDIILIVKNKEKAQSIKEKVLEKIGALKLSVNTNSDKFLEGYVRDLKYSVITKSFEKYFIDGLDKEFVSQEILDISGQMLENILKDDFNNVDVKQLPFYLTHLIDDEVVESKKREIQEYVLNTPYGRGSIFKHYYNNLMLRNKNTYLYLESLINLKGLSRSNIITALIQKNDYVDKKQLQTLIESYLKLGDLESYERKELIRLILFSKIDIDESLLNPQDKEYLILNIKFVESFCLSPNLETACLQRFQYLNRQKNIDVISILDAYLKKVDKIHNLDDFITTLEAILNTDNEETFITESEQELANLICFITLYTQTTDRALQGMWKRFLKSNFENISMKDWYKYERNISFDKMNDQVVSYFITNVSQGISFNPDEELSDYEKLFAYYLIAFLFKEKTTSNVISEDLKKSLKSLISDKNLKFLEWCLDDNSRYYPDNGLIASRNIYYNNRIVLRNDTKLLVRGEKTIFDATPTNEIYEETWFSGKNYAYQILEIPRNASLSDIRGKLKGLNLIQAIKKVYFYLNMVDKESVNYFELGTLSDVNDDIKFKYSKFDKQIILNETIDFPNEPKRMKEEIVNLLKDGSLIDTNADSYIYDSTKFEEEFVPVLQGKYKINLVDYILILGKYLTENLDNNEIDAIKIEDAKIRAIEEYLKLMLRRKAKATEVISVYSTLCRNNTNRLIAFKQQEIRKENALEFIDDIIASIKFDQFTSLQGFLSYLQKGYKQIETLETSSGIKSKIFVRINRFEEQTNQSDMVRVNDKSIEIDHLKVIRPFDEMDLGGTFEQLIKSQIKELKVKYSLYTDGVQFIIAVPRILEKIGEKIESITEAFEDDKDRALAALKSLRCFDQAREVVSEQNDISLNEAEIKLFSFLRNFENHEMEPMVKLISKYTVMKHDKIKKFTFEIKDFMKESSTCVLPLKKQTDDNGFTLIINSKSRDIGFDRNSPYLDRLWNDYKKICEGHTIKTLITVSDIGCGGTQWTRIFNGYLSDNKNDPEAFEEITSEKFIEMLLKIEKFIIKNVIYTDRYKSKIEEEIKTFYKSHEYEIPEIIFEGELLEVTKHCFANAFDVHKDKADVKKILSKEFYANLPVYHKAKCKFNSTVENLEVEQTSNLLVARYKSMPKAHLVPLTVDNAIFRYRKDRK